MNLDKEIEKTQKKYGELMKKIKEIENKIQELFKKRYNR